MIEARKLRKVYGRTVAVDGIDFQVKPGHVTGSSGRTAPPSPILDIDTSLQLLDPPWRRPEQ